MNNTTNNTTTTTNANIIKTYTSITKQNYMNNTHIMININN